MKIIKGNLVLTEDTTFGESIRVEGDITCMGGWFNLTVHGDIDAIDIIARDIDANDIFARDIIARDIDANDIRAFDIIARDIIARDIDANDIDANDIDAFDINSHDINARSIICIKRIKKHKDSKTIAYSLVTDKFSRKRKEQMPEAIE